MLEMLLLKEPQFSSAVTKVSCLDLKILMQVALTYLGAQLGWSGCQSGHYYVLASVPYVKDYKYQPSGAWVEYPSYSNVLQWFIL